MIIRVQKYLIDLSLIYLIGEIRHDEYIDYSSFYLYPLNDKEPIPIMSNRHKKVLPVGYVDRTDNSRDFDINYHDSAEFNEIVSDLERIRSLIVDEWLKTKNQSQIKIIE